MASVSTYLNFPRNTEEAFNYYKSIFGGEFFGQGIMRFSDIPSSPDSPPIAEEDKNSFLIKRGDVTGFKDALKKLISNPTLYSEMIE